MSSIADVIAVSSDRPMYPQAKSRWFGKAAGKKDLGLMAMAYGHVYVAQVAMQGLGCQ